MSFHPSGHDPRANKRTRRVLAKLNLLFSPDPLLMKRTLVPSVVTPSDTVGYILRTGPSVVTEVLNGQGNWIAPFTGTITVKARGAGGGGGIETSNASGGAGGGGAYAESAIAVTEGVSYPYSCGVGGRGGSFSGSGPGSDGGNTTFNTTDVVADSGKGGGVNTAGALGGAAGSCTGTIKFGGGNGGDGAFLVGTGGAGGGSSADEGGAGNAGGNSSGTGGAPGGVAVDDDGAGGDGGMNSVGSDGQFPGGGGGSGADGFDGGAGADGEIILEYSYSGVYEAEWVDPTLYLATLAFKTIAVSGQSNVVADALDDTLTLAVSGQIAITTNSATDTITFTVTAGTVTHTAGALTANQLVIGAGGADEAALGSLGTTATVLHGNAGGAPSFGPVDLAADVTGNLGVSHLNSGTSASNTTFWRGDGVWAAPPAGSGVSIGDAIGGGTANWVLFVDGSGNLGQSTDLQFDASSKHLSTVIISCSNGALGASFCSSGVAGALFDGTNGVQFADGTYAIYIYAGSIKVLGTSGNTIRWENNTSAPSTQTLLSLPLNVYGAGTITDLLGDPDAWVLINIGGTNYKLPAYL